MTRKKPINSKAKGSEYERKIAKVLGAWWGEQFQRTPMSGGLHWKEDNRVAGDIVTPPNSVYPWTTECKKRQEWTLEQVLKGTGDVEKWWKQAVSDGKRVNLKPLLIFSKNFAPDYMMMTHSDFCSIANNIPEADFNFFMVHIKGEKDRIVCNLEDFIKNISKSDVMRAFNLEK